MDFEHDHTIISNDISLSGLLADKKSDAFALVS